MAQPKQSWQPWINPDIQEACRAALSNFAALTWPDKVDKYIFPKSLKEKGATAGVSQLGITLESTTTMETIQLSIIS